MLEEEWIIEDYDGPTSTEPTAPAPTPARAQSSDEWIIEDYDPPEPAPASGAGSYLPEIGKGIVSGAVEATGAAIRGAGGLYEAGKQAVQERMAATKARRDMGLQGRALWTLPPEEREAAKQALREAEQSVEDTDVTQNPVYQFGRDVSDWSEEQFAAAKGWEDSWTRAISQGLGSIAPLIAGTVAAGPVAGLAIGTAAGSAMSSGEAIDRAVEAGASREQILEALSLGALPGLTEQVPIEVALERIPLPLYGRFLNVVGKVLAKASVEGGQEAVQQAGQNIIENYVYNPEQGLSEGVFEAAVVGAAVGGIVGGATTRPERTNREKQQEHDAAVEVVPPGIEETETQVAAGQVTPGGTGQTATPPPGAEAPAEPSASEVVDVPDDIAAAMSGEEVVSPASRAAEPAGETAIPIVDEEAEFDVSEDVDADEDFDQRVQEAAQRQAEAVRGAFAEQGIPEEEDVFASAKAQEAAAETTQVMDEDLDLAAALGAAQGDYAEVSTPATVEQVTSAPPQLPANVPPPSETAPASVQPTPPADLVAQAPQPTVSVPTVPAEAPAEVMPQGAPPASVLPEPVSVAPGPVEARPAQPLAAPAPNLPPSNLVSRTLAEQVRQELYTDPISEHPDFSDVVEQVSRALAGSLPPGTPPARAAAERLADAVSQVRQDIEAGDAARQAEEAVQAASQQSRAQEAAKRRLREGGAQERERTGKTKGKSRVGILAESEKSTARAAKAEMEKPEAERDVDLMEWENLRQMRAKLPRRGDAAAARRKAIAKEMKAAQKRRAERAGREVVEPEPKETEVTPRITAEEAQDVTREARTESDAARRAREATKAKQRGEKVAPALKKAVDDTPQPNWDRMTTATLRTSGREYLKTLVKNANAALKESGEKLNEGLNRRYNTPEENLVIFAKELLDGRKHPGMDTTEFVVAKSLLDNGHIEEFNNLIGESALTKATVQAHEGLSGDVTDVAPDTSPQYDEGSNQFILPMVRRGGETRTEMLTDRNGAVKVFSGTAVNAGDVLRRVNREMDTLSTQDKAPDFVRRMHIKVLRQTVGDMNVMLVAPDVIQDVLGTDQGIGFYAEYQGRPVVAVDEDVFNRGHPEDRAHVIVHELTHAATVKALQENRRGTRQIVETMRASLEKQLKDLGAFDLLPHSQQYGFTDAYEFIAEAFSNPSFQQLLAETEVPAAIRQQIGRLPGFRSSWWDVFVDMVANALGRFRGIRKGHSYLEQVIAVYPSLVSPDTQGGPGKTVANPSGPFDTKGLIANARTAQDAVKEKAEYGWASGVSRKLAAKLSTTQELVRKAERVFEGDAMEAYRKWAHEFLARRSTRDKYREAGDRIVVDLAKERAARPQAVEELSDILHDATLAGVDPSVSIDHPRNKHIGKTGFRSAYKRRMHAQLQARWAKLPESTKAVGRRITENYTAQNRKKVHMTVANAIDNAISKGRAELPPGVTTDKAVEWITSGAVDRSADEQTQFDRDMHKALGKTAEAFKGTSRFLKEKGLYVPLTRWGRYYFTALEKLDKPAGATLDQTAKDRNRFIFTDRKKLDHYLETTEHQVDRVQSSWVDRKTGERSHKSDINAVQIFYATVQNRIMEMADSASELQEKRKEYDRAGGFETTDIGVFEEALTGRSEILPGQLNRLIHHIRQNGKSEATRDAVVHAIGDAYVRQLAGSRASKNRLRRTGQKGFSRDLVQATLSANHTMAGHLANLEQLPKMAAYEETVREAIHDARRMGKGNADTLRRQQLFAELKTRIGSIQSRNEGSAGARLANSIMDLSFMAHLFSPSYTMVNMTQPWAVTYPVMAGKFGSGATLRAIAKAYHQMGAGATIGRGLLETGRQATVLDRHDYAADLKKRVAKLDNADLIVQALDQLERLGFGTTGGIEAAEVAGMERTRAERAITRLTRIGRALPEAAEAVNRYTTAIAAVNLGKRAGWSDADIVKYAVDTVERTQGGYAAENNPSFMSNPLLRLPLQFKKYSVLYGQLYYGELARLVNVNSDRQTRVDAAKALARLSLMSVIMAGAFGLPLMEWGRVANLIAAGMGLTDDDWEDWENGLQSWVSGMIGDKPSEVLTRGASRLLEFDTSSRLGNDNMVLFGEPMKFDEAHTKSWLFDLLAGAPGGMVGDTIKAIHDRSIAEAAPLPKFVKDLMKTYRLGTEGRRTHAGRQISEPLTPTEMLWQSIGFRPARLAREWEARGSGAEFKKGEGLRAERSKVMGEWVNAPPHRRIHVYETKIRQWNREHPDMPIDRGNLQRSLARRKKLEAG